MVHDYSNLFSIGRIYMESYIQYYCILPDYISQNLNSYTSVLGYTSINTTLNSVERIRFTHMGNRMLYVGFLSLQIFSFKIAMRL